MTKEQEKAIEGLKSLSPSESDIEIVLNMLKEKDKEIERLRYIKKSFDYVVQKETEKKDKIIDLMAKAIDNYDSQLEINTFRDKEHVKQYFKEIAERKREEC